MKTSELTGAALDWAVAKALGHKVGLVNTRRGPEPCVWVDSYEGDVDLPVPKYSTDWAQGGPIIERENIGVGREWDNGEWLASSYAENAPVYKGPTPLSAAMRCYVASKLGDEIELPAELI